MDIMCCVQCCIVKNIVGLSVYFVIHVPGFSVASSDRATEGFGPPDDCLASSARCQFYRPRAVWSLYILCKFCAFFPAGIQNLQAYNLALNMNTQWCCVSNLFPAKFNQNIKCVKCECLSVSALTQLQFTQIHVSQVSSRLV